MKYKRSRAEQKQLLMDEGCIFERSGCKHRYVGIYGDRRRKRLLRRALRWDVMPYPKRQHVSEAIGRERQATGSNSSIASLGSQQNANQGMLGNVETSMP